MAQSSGIALWQASEALFMRQESSIRIPAEFTMWVLPARKSRN
jgi:hypothetical protein